MTGLGLSFLQIKIKANASAILMDGGTPTSVDVNALMNVNVLLIKFGEDTHIVHVNASLEHQTQVLLVDLQSFKQFLFALEVNSGVKKIANACANPDGAQMAGTTTNHLQQMENANVGQLYHDLSSLYSFLFVLDQMICIMITF